MKTKKIILIAVAVAVVVGGGIWFFTGSPAKHKVMYAVSYTHLTLPTICSV